MCVCVCVYIVIWFNAISTISGYFMPKPIYIYIKYMICKYILELTF